MTGESSSQPTTGSGLLLRKLPILSRARALAKQRPSDPQAECNALSYGSDVYRVLALDSDPDARLLLSTRLPFLARLEARFSRASAAASAAAGAEGDAAAGDGDGDSDDAPSQSAAGAEERAMLRAIRAPVAPAGPGAPGALEGPAGPGALAGPGAPGALAGGGRGAEAMLSALMAQHGSADDDGVRAYLRRVAWIEQRKRTVAPPQPGELAWASMTEAGKVQREMQHVVAQRKRFRRERKEKKE